MAGCVGEQLRIGYSPHLKKTQQEKLEHFQENEEAHEQAGCENLSCPHFFGTQDDTVSSKAAVSLGVWTWIWTLKIQHRFICD